MSNPVNSRSRIDEARRRLDQWEPVMRPEGPPDWFDGAVGMPAFDPDAAAFSPSNAWWLAELCRIAYTPDGKESGRPWHRDKPSRHEFIESHTPFREILNLHKTGNHVSLYQLDGGAAAVLCFRGTNKLRQWIMNLTALPAKWSRTPEGGSGFFVHRGIQILFNRVWPLIEPSLADLEGPLILTGHSLGAAFSTLAAASLARPPAWICTFGSPRVGNEAFVGRLAGIPHHRVVNRHDMVPLLPLSDSWLGERDYRHTGELVQLTGHPPGEDADDSGWPPENPLALVAASIGRPDPPDWVIDHLPVNYSRQLRALAVKLTD